MSSLFHGCLRIQLSGVYCHSSDMLLSLFLSPFSSPLLVCCAVLSCFSHVQLFETLWAIARQAPLSMGIHQARILEWVAMPSSRGSLRPRDQTHISFGSPIVGKFFTTDPPEKLVSLCLFFFKKFRFGEGVKIDTCTQSTILTRIHYLIVFFLHL